MFCIESALGTGLEALVVVASTMGAVAPDDFAQLTPPKLFVCAEDDAANLAYIVAERHDLSPEPKELMLLPGTVHGTELFNTKYNDLYGSARLRRTGVRGGWERDSPCDDCVAFAFA